MGEADMTAEAVQLDEHETTGLLPVGFEFEHASERYDHFEVSTDGFILFLRGTDRRALPQRVWLVGRGTGCGGARVSYEVVGQAPRRRLLILLVEDGPLAARVLVTVHERTGIVESEGRVQSFGEPTIRQLDIVQSSPSRANSARKIG
jgi:hypothetical protein